MPVFLLTGALHVHTAVAQPAPLRLTEAVATGVNQYQSIQAKRNYLKASQSMVHNAQNEYLPNVLASLQQDYGTINGQLGPLSAYGAAGVASSGLPAATQSWTAAFGASYVINTNWEVFTFGRVLSRIKLAQSAADKDAADLDQETFVQSVKISGAYLNLLIAQRMQQVAQSNLERAEAVQRVVRARTMSGLNAGVDSSIANAEVSKARLSLIDAGNNVLQAQNQLVQQMNIAPAALALDSFYLGHVPANYKTDFPVADNPQVKFYQSRINQSLSTTQFLRRSITPGLNLFGILQTRASGFDYNYASDNTKYTTDYLTGINPTRTNYVAGVSLAWNLTSPIKIHRQVRAQQYITEAYKNEYDLVETQLRDQLVLADQRIDNSIKSLKEAPAQYKAANDAYIQKSVLYKNGLSNIVDLQQAMYLLNRAEADIAAAYINVWQALLLKSASSGDFDLFIKQTR